MHLLSKYVRARNERLLSVEDSIRYAFRNVGVAIVVNTIILSAGFLVMTTSAFKMNVDLGLMTILSIFGALILDFLLLPALLLFQLGNALLLYQNFFFAYLGLYVFWLPWIGSANAEGKPAGSTN